MMRAKIPTPATPILLLVILIFLTINASQSWSQEEDGPRVKQKRDVSSETKMKITAPLTVAAVGDIIEPQPLTSNDPRYLALVDQIRKSDVGFANMESTLVDFAHFNGPVAGIEAPLSMGQALKAMGITIMNRANNHTLDGGLEGMFSTDAELDKLGIAHAGTGKDLQAARAPGYQNTPKGRVGLVGMYSTDESVNTSRGAATARNGDIGGAPGENVLRLTSYHVVTTEHLQQMKDIAASTYGNRPNAYAPPQSDGQNRFKFFNEWFQAGSNPGTIAYEMNPRDEKEIMTSIRNGKIYADFMIVTIHCHQLAHFSTFPNADFDHDTPDFLIKLAHDSVENGADMFVGHGEHTLRGIEIYKGKPIFYDISNFVFQFGIQFGASYDVLANETGMARLEGPDSQGTVLTTSHFEDGNLKEIRLYPVELGGPDRPLSQLGIPLAASTDEARRILNQLQELSKPFGTVISIEGNVGVIRVNNEGQSIAATR
jgi:poly-gamma-glutamate synthesis protein (capsule biosynthesis protein)